MRAELLVAAKRVDLALELLDLFCQLLNFALVVVLFLRVLFLVFRVALVDQLSLKEIRLKDRAVFLFRPVVVSLGNGVRSFVEVQSVNIRAVLISSRGLGGSVRNRLGDFLLHSYKN